MTNNTPDALPKAAVKFDGQKQRLDLVPWDAIIAVANVFQHGAMKYEARNWEKGFDWSRLIAAAKRHLTWMEMGEDTDPDSGLEHIDHAVACVLMLSATVLRKIGTDDRYKLDPVVIEKLRQLNPDPNGSIAAMKEKKANETNSTNH